MMENRHPPSPEVHLLAFSQSNTENNKYQSHLTESQAAKTQQELASVNEYALSLVFNVCSSN